MTRKVNNFMKLSFISILLKVKHNKTFLWDLIQIINNALMYYENSKIKKVIAQKQVSQYFDGIQFKLLQKHELVKLLDFLTTQSPERLTFFKPHAFDLETLIKLNKSNSFYMFGVLKESKIIGYFFLRCFFNKKCFVGRIIDEKYEGKGIGKKINNLLYNIGWDSGYNVYSTISKQNSLVIRSHKNNPYYNKIKDLSDDYMLIQFISNDSKKIIQ